MSVKVSNLTKQYGEQLAVNHISFELNKGEVLGFLGPNGAGKSTTMKMITGYVEPTEGSIEVCGINQQENPLLVKEKIGYLPENNPLYYDMYVKEYLGFVADIYKIKNKKERIDQLIEKTGLEREQRKKIGQLSKGYKQRVGIAQAMIHNPDVLILDEPTSGLDPNQLVDIRNLIKELGKEKTVILSTHIMQEVEAMCQRVLIINQGKIVANNKVESIKSGNSKNTQVRFKLKTNKTQLPTLEQVQFEVLGNGFVRATSKQKQNLSEEIFNYCVANKLTLLHLEQENQSMEDVFKQLTK